MKVLRKAAAVAAAMILAGPALATGTFECEDVGGGDAWASILTTRAGSAMFMPLRADFGTGQRAWSTENRPGAETIFVAHAYGDANEIIAEFTDDDLEGPVVSLRLALGSTEESAAIAGVLVITGVGAWAVSCEAE